MTHLRFLPVVVAIFACTRLGSPSATPTAAVAPTANIERTRGLLTALAHDSMEGRRVASAGEARAARFIAEQMKASGIEPAGDANGWFQRLPLITTTIKSRTQSGEIRERVGIALMPSFADLDSVPAERRLTSVNVLGILRGSDPQLSSEVVILGSHFDHLGVRSGAAEDSINNGADDNGSGTVAVIESARIIAGGPRPRRTILFATFTGEESGAFGVRHYTQHPVVPLERHVADVQVEMIGRPDTSAGGPGRAWLTGFDRSTMGSILAEAGVPVQADRRLEFRFFERSDNISFARLGIVAHTLSS
jgi:acetylornithine deacetylase/succinyl-diaminopimelate desuccinylase-like protein